MNFKLYNSVAKPVRGSTSGPRAKLTRHYTEDITDISLYEIRIALKHLKTNKVPGEDGIVSELLNAGGTPVLIVVQKFFNSVLLEGVTPEAWNGGVVVLFFKKAVLVIGSFGAKSTRDDIMRRISNTYSQYQCWKLSTCKNGGPKICGFDEELAELSVFEDICTMYKANCKSYGMYIKVEMEVCDAKKNFQAEYGDTFDWKPIARPGGVTKGVNLETAVPQNPPYVDKTKV